MTNVTHTSTLSWGQVARRPRWIAALILVMLVAAGFAWLGKWQLERAVLNARVTNYHTETVVPLDSLTLPRAYPSDRAAGHMASITAVPVADTLTIISGRLNGNKSGFWVVGEVETSDARLAVAYGWTSTQSAAEAVVTELGSLQPNQSAVRFVGRYMPSEDPTEPKPDQNPQTLTTMAPAALINVWPASTKPVYAGYLVEKSAPNGSTTIVSTPPIDDTSLNWLNVFYGAEWIVFAGFAFYLWYRLVKDAKQREEDSNLPRVN